MIDAYLMDPYLFLSILIGYFGDEHVIKLVLYLVIWL